MQRSINVKALKYGTPFCKQFQELPKTSFKIKLKLFLLQSHNSTNF